MVVFLGGNSLLRATGPQQKAWNVVGSGAAEKSPIKRGGADNPEVRASAAVALEAEKSSSTSAKVESTTKSDA